MSAIDESIVWLNTTIGAAEVSKLRAAGSIPLLAADDEFLAQLRTIATTLAQLSAAAEGLAHGCEVALWDFDNLVNPHLVKITKTHPFTLTPADLRAALAAYEQFRQSEATRSQHG